MMNLTSPTEHSESIPARLIQNLLSVSDIGQLLKTLTDYVESNFNGMQSLILIYDPVRHQLVPGENVIIPLDDQVLQSIPVHLKSSTSGRAAATKCIVMTPDIMLEEAWIPYRQEALNRNVRSALAIPMLSPKQELLGVFTFYFSQPQVDLPPETNFLKTLSSIVAVSLERYFQEKKTQNILGELKASQERLGLALMSQKMGVWDWYLETDQVIWDKTVFEIFGTNPHEFSGTLKDWESKLHPDDHAEKMQTLADIIQNKTTFLESFRIVRDGVTRHISCAGSVVRDSQGKPVRMTGLHWDVTDKKEESQRSEQERAKAIANAKMASLGEMASGVAHEINNPLTIILNRANQLKARLEMDQLEKTWALRELERIENTVERIAKIIRGLRAFSRNADSDPMISCEFNSIMDETLELCRERFKRFGVSFSIRGLQNSFTLKCRPSQISQVLLNLFNNSFDAIVNTPNPWMEIDINLVKNMIQLRITDSGNGIPSHLVDKIMDPFFSTKEVGRGTGLGLSISKGIIEDHGGRLWYDKENRNTCFVIDLPAELIQQSIPETQVTSSLAIIFNSPQL